MKKNIPKPKIIISWIATGNDFKAGEVNKSGPTFNLHRYFYTENSGHDFHLLLHADTGDKKSKGHAQGLLEALQASPAAKKHTIRLVEIPIKDVIGFQEIYGKVKDLLFRYRQYEIDLFISPGTPMMQVCWVLCHIEKIADTRLYQARRPEHTTHKAMPEFFETVIDISKESYLLAVKDQVTTGKTYFEYGIGRELERARKIAQASNASVLITGETGTGKEGLARMIHDNSSRFNHPFNAVNCAAYPDELLQAELFGSVKGAFTGAVDRQGVFESSEGGTLFLDEIGDISPRVQVALLRVLQDGSFQRLGENKSRKCDVRIVSATNKPLYEMAVAGTYRLDLFYRLAGGRVHLPPLRERGETAIRETITSVSNLRALLYGKAPLKWDKSAWKLLVSYPFPGNIRELENILDELYIFHADSAVHTRDVSAVFQTLGEPLMTKKHGPEKLDDVITAHCRTMLDRYGTIEAARKALGISANTFKKYMGKLSP